MRLLQGLLTFFSIKKKKAELRQKLCIYVPVGRDLAVFPRAPQGDRAWRCTPVCLTHSLLPARWAWWFWGSRGHLGPWVTLRREATIQMAKQKEPGSLSYIQQPWNDHLQVSLETSSSLSPCYLVAAVQSLSRVQLFDPMDCSTPGFSVLHRLWDFVQTHVHCVGDAILPSHPLSPFSCPQSFSASGSFPIGPNLIVTYWPSGLFFMLKETLSKEKRIYYQGKKLCTHRFRGTGKQPLRNEVSA